MYSRPCRKFRNLCTPGMSPESLVYATRGVVMIHTAFGDFFA